MISRNVTLSPVHWGLQFWHAKQLRSPWQSFYQSLVHVWRKTAPHLKEKGTEILKLQNSDWKNVGAL